MSHKSEKIISLLEQLSAEFLNRRSNGSSLITVTKATLSDDFKRATIFISVLPEGKEEEALNFTKRQRQELRDFIKEKAKFGTLPFLEIELDYGEKNRQRIDELLQTR